MTVLVLLLLEFPALTDDSLELELLELLLDDDEDELVFEDDTVFEPEFLLKMLLMLLMIWPAFSDEFPLDELLSVLVTVVTVLLPLEPEDLIPTLGCEEDSVLVTVVMVLLPFELELEIEPELEP